MADHFKMPARELTFERLIYLCSCVLCGMQHETGREYLYSLVAAYEKEVNKEHPEYYAYIDVQYQSKEIHTYIK